MGWWGGWWERSWDKWSFENGDDVGGFERDRVMAWKESMQGRGGLSVANL